MKNASAGCSDGAVCAAGWTDSGPLAAGLSRLVLGQSESFKKEEAEL